MPSRTNLKLAEVIRQRAAHVILHELKDPRMGFVTITHVKLAPDLTSAKVYWSVLGGDSERSKTIHALEHARGFVQRRVAEGLRLRNAPELLFDYDEAVEGAIKMGGILKQLRTERGEDPLAGAAPGEEAAVDRADDADEASDDADPDDDESDEAESDEAEDPDDEDADDEDPDDEDPDDEERPRDP